MTAVRQSIVAPPGAPAAAGAYSHGLVFGGLLFCSGQTAIDPATGELIRGTVADQTRRCLENLAATCQAAGADLRNAVRVAVYMTNLADFPEMNAAYGDYFRDPDAPARTTIGVAALPRGAELEVDAIVALPAAA